MSKLQEGNHHVSGFSTGTLDVLIITSNNTTIQEIFLLED